MVINVEPIDKVIRNCSQKGFLNANNSSVANDFVIDEPSYLKLKVSLVVFIIVRVIANEKVKNLNLLEKSF